MAAADQIPGNRPQNITWYLSLVAILLAGLVIWIAVSLRINVFTEVLKRDEPVSILLTVDDGKTPLLISLLIFDPQTSNGALVAIPGETGGLLRTLDRVDRLEVLYEPENRNIYSDAVSSLIGHSVDFSIRFDRNGFEHFVDYLGGIDLFIAQPVKDTIEEQTFLFPSGSVRLDGAKALSYLEYRPLTETREKRLEREHQIIQSLIRGIRANVDQLLSDSVFPYISDVVHSDFDQRSLQSFMRALAEINADRLIFHSILGTRRLLDGQEVLFPYYEGRLVRETVERIRETLIRENEFSEDILTIRVEIKNGTNVTGLASRTAQVMRSYGFRVVSVSNAERSDYERTAVLDRRGNPDAARRVAELIRCKQFYTQFDTDGDETVDVTIVLGKDFDGRYVKN